MTILLSHLYQTWFINPYGNHNTSYIFLAVAMARIGGLDKERHLNACNEDVHVLVNLKASKIPSLTSSTKHSTITAVNIQNVIWSPQWTMSDKDLIR